jgi:hypothetical protein
MQPDSSTRSVEADAPPAAHADDADAERPRFVLERRVDGKLWLLRGGHAVAVDLVRCFPWTEPRRFFSFRDAKGDEHAFVRDLDDLEPESRAVVTETLRRASFVLDVVEILSVEEDFELRSWRIRAAQGVRSFQTALDAWPRKLPDGALLLEDVYGDLYRVPLPGQLDAKSRELLWAFVD